MKARNKVKGKLIASMLMFIAMMCVSQITSA